MELWKNIEGVGNRYQVSNQGKVKRVKYTTITKNGRCLTYNERILTPQIIGGYPAVYISDVSGGKQVWRYVHRLVAEAFIPNPENLPIINHKDERPENNFVWVNEDGTVNLEKSNLEWCTVKYNINYGTAKERRRETHIKNNTWKDYSRLSDEDKKNRQKEKAREYYLSHSTAKRRGRYESLKKLTKEEKEERHKKQQAEWYKKRYCPKKHSVIVFEYVPQQVAEFGTTSEAAEYIGTTCGSIYANINGKTKSIKTDKGLFMIKRK